MEDSTCEVCMCCMTPFLPFFSMGGEALDRGNSGIYHMFYIYLWHGKFRVYHKIHGFTIS